MAVLPVEPLQRRNPKADRLPGGYDLNEANFLVEEVPRYEPSGEGDHLFARIEKVGWSTMPLVHRMAELLGCDSEDIGFAGLKDRHAVTRQWFSFPGEIDPADLTSLEIEGMQVLDVSRHDNKLKVGHLRANRFRIDHELSGGVTQTEAIRRLRALLDDLIEHGVPNYFGSQRFGSEGRNLEKGLRMVRRGPRSREARRIPKHLRRLIVSSVQSEVFNRVLARRIETFDRIQDGDIAWIHQSGACFAVDDALAERVRCSRFEISPSGPLPGPKCLIPGGEAAKIEALVASELGVDHRAFGAFRSNPGERRPLRVSLRDPKVEPTPGDPTRVRLSFELDRGTFATTVLRELVANPPWFQREAPDEPGQQATTSSPTEVVDSPSVDSPPSSAEKSD